MIAQWIYCMDEEMGHKGVRPALTYLSEKESRKDLTF
jgi:hypothetical protein